MSAPGLVEQLQAGATDGKTPLGDLLRKTKLAATKLQIREMDAWASAELNGYTDDLEIPDYRVLVGEIKGLNPFHGWISVSGIGPVQRKCTQSIAHIERLIQSSDGAAVASLTEEESSGLRRMTGINFEFKLKIPIPSLVSLLDGVRNKILDWTIELERQGIHGNGLSFSRDEVQAAQSGTTHNVFHGPVAAIAQHQSSIERVAQHNAANSLSEVEQAISSLLREVQASRTEDTGAAGAVAVLTEVNSGIQQGQAPPYARVKAALDMLRTSEDIALKAPQVIDRLHQLGVAIDFLS